jgi:hypothetical protein
MAVLAQHFPAGLRAKNNRTLAGFSDDSARCLEALCVAGQRPGAGERQDAQLEAGGGGWAAGQYRTRGYWGANLPETENNGVRAIVLTSWPAPGRRRLVTERWWGGGCCSIRRGTPRWRRSAQRHALEETAAHDSRQHRRAQPPPSCSAHRSQRPVFRKLKGGGGTRRRVAEIEPGRDRSAEGA